MSALPASLLEALDQARYAVVNAPAGSNLWWRVQRVTTDHQARIGIAQLRMVFASQDVQPKEGEDVETLGARAVANASDADVERLLKAQQAKLAAGIVGLGLSEAGPFEPIQIVEEKRRDTAKGLLSQADIPLSAVDLIVKAIDQIDDPNGEAARRLATFRR